MVRKEELAQVDTKRERKVTCRYKLFADAFALIYFGFTVLEFMSQKQFNNTCTLPRMLQLIMVHYT